MSTQAYVSVLAALAEATRVMPHMRIGQIIVNAVARSDAVYYVEDAQLAEAIRDYVDSCRTED